MASPLHSLRRVATASVNLLLSRAEFASLELAEARVQLLRWFLRGLLAMQLILLAAFAATALLVALLWPYAGAWSLLGIAVLYAGIALWLLGDLQRETDASPPPLSETLRQLADDRRAIFGVAAEEVADADDADPVREPPR